MSLSIFLGEITSVIPERRDYGLGATWANGEVTAQAIFDILATLKCSGTSVDSAGTRKLWFHRPDNVWLQINLLPDNRLTIELGEPAA